MILNVDSMLKRSNYRSLKRFICLKLILKKFLYNAAISVQPPYISGHSL